MEHIEIFGIKFNGAPIYENENRRVLKYSGIWGFYTNLTGDVIYRYSDGTSRNQLPDGFNKECIITIPEPIDNTMFLSDKEMIDEIKERREKENNN